MSEVVDKVVEIIKRIGGIDTLEPDENFYRAGIDSMAGMDVMLDLETEFDLTIPDDQFVAARTANDLAALVERLRNA